MVPMTSFWRFAQPAVRGRREEEAPDHGEDDHGADPEHEAGGRVVRCVESPVADEHDAEQLDDQPDREVQPDHRSTPSVPSILVCVT